MKLHLPLTLRCLVLLCLSAVPAVQAVVGSTWDPAWGAAGLEGAPDASAAQYQATITAAGVTALVPPTGQEAPWDFGSYTAITLTGSGNAEAIIVGGASATLTPLVGAVERNSWIAAGEGSYNLFIGGSYADNWQSGAAFNFTGNSHIMVDGASVANIVGGNYKEGRNAEFTGNSYITVAAGNVTGAIVGATVVTHNANTSFNGNTHIFVYTPLSSNAGPGLNSVPTNMIMGGFAWGTNTWKTQTLEGSTYVTVDLADYAGNVQSFSKHIVGGGFNGASSNTQVITGDTNVSVNLSGVAMAANSKVVGGAWVNAGTASITGTSTLTISGGTFNSWVLGGFWTDSGGTNTSVGEIRMSLSGGTYNGSVLGATYISTGNCTMNTGNVSLSVGGDSVVGGTLYGGYYINGNANATVDATLGNINITLDGGVLESVVGGSYTQRNNAESFISQGNIVLNLQSGSVNGDIYSAGYQDGTTYMETASTTVQLSPAVLLTEGITISGGYTGSYINSVVTGERVLQLLGAGSYTNTAAVLFKDFDVVQVAEGASATLSSLTSDSSALRKTGSGSLTLSGHSAFDSLTVEAGSLSLQGGVEGTRLRSLSLAAGTSLAGVSGTISAGAPGETELSLALSPENIGADEAATPMITGLGDSPVNLALHGAENVTLDIGADGVVGLLLAHKNAFPSVSSYLSLVDGELTCEQPAQLPLNALLAAYGLRIAGVADGSLVVNGSAAGIYYVTSEAETTDPHLVTEYPVLGLYSGVVIESGQSLTLSLSGDDDATTVATVNNLMGASGSLLQVENNSGSGLVTVVLRNGAINSTGDPNYPDIPSRTMMAGDILATTGTELVKQGVGTLEVEGNLRASSLVMTAGTLLLNGSGNRVEALSGSGATLQVGGALQLCKSLEGSGTLVVNAGGTLLLDNISSAGNAWTLANSGSAVADVTTSGSLNLVHLSLGAGSRSELVFNTDAPFANSLLLGSLAVEPGAAVTLNSVGDTLLRGGDYVLGKVEDSAATNIQGAVTLSLQGFSFSQLQPGASYLYTDAAGRIILHAVRSSSNLLLPYAASHNARAGARLLWDATPPPGGELAAAYRSVTELIASGQRVSAGRAMAAVAGAAFSALSPAMQGDVERRLRSIRNRAVAAGVNPCVVNNGMPYYHFWVQGEGDYSSLGSSGDSPGYDFSRWGATLGMSADVSEAFSAGLAFSALWGELRTDAPDALESDADASYLSFFARYRNCSWSHTLAGAFGWTDFDTNRRVHMGTTHYHTHSAADGRAFGLMYELAYDHLSGTDEGWNIQPLLNISYRHSSVGGFTEHGSDAALKVAPHSMNTLTLAAGARMQATIGENWYNRSSRFECHALLAFDIGNRRGEASVALMNGSARESVLGSRPGAFGVELGAGLSVPLGAESGTLFFEASVILRSRLSEFNGGLGYTLPF
ncbi:MAG: autotransporter domain-containing protein [Akkermansia sp.]|nr:autotransporter domain-containing protein [Akkermansia sp.]